MSAEEKSMFQEWYDYDMAHARDIVQNLVRASMVLVIFGFLEATLKKVILNVKSTLIHQNQKNAIIKQRSKVISNCIGLLQKRACMNIPIFFDLELELVTKIRNAYAHNSGILLRVEKNEIERLARQIGGNQNDLTSFKIHKVEPNVYTIEFFSQYVDILIEKIEDSLYDILAQLRLRP